MARRGGKTRQFLCSLLGDGEYFPSYLFSVECKTRLTISRYEDEKVIQALEILKKEAGFPFVEYI